jgi:hypothetical protein
MGLTMSQNTISIQSLPDRNFVAGWPKNPATYIATRDDDGHYYEAFASEYASKADFARAAAIYFERH